MTETGLAHRDLYAKWISLYSGNGSELIAEPILSNSLQSPLLILLCSDLLLFAIRFVMIAGFTL